MRTSEIKRTTAETDISLTLSLDGTGKADIDSGVPFLDHMLTLLCVHGRMDMTLRCKGDTDVDDHHSAEDIGICLGEAIRQALAEQPSTIRVPVGTQQNARLIRRAVRRLTPELGRDPTDPEVADAAGLPLATIRRLRHTRQVDMQSLNELIGDDGESDGIELQDFMADESSPAPDAELLRLEDIDQLLTLLETLPEREKQVLKLRFGLDGSPIMTLESVGELLNCTSERVRQIQNQALKRLQKQMTG